MQGVGSHMPILKGVLDMFKVNSVVEFGMGMNSTVLFADKLKSGISIEMQNKSWYDKMESTIDNWNLKFMLGELDAITYVDSLKQDFNLMFVDGHGLTRWSCVNLGFKKNIPMIIAHDTQEKSYQWSKIKIPNNYNCQSYSHNTGIGTTIFSINDISKIDFENHTRVDFGWIRG